LLWPRIGEWMERIA